MRCFFYVQNARPVDASDGLLYSGAWSCHRRPELKARFVASRALAMGWISAVGGSQHLHRNVLRIGNQLPAHLARIRELRWQAPPVISSHLGEKVAWQVYIDNLDLFEVVDAGESRALQQIGPSVLAIADQAYEAWGAAGHKAKDILRSLRVKAQGDAVDWEAGCREPPAG